MAIARHRHRIVGAFREVNRNPHLLTQHAQLIDRGRPVQVAGRKKR